MFVDDPLANPPHSNLNSNPGSDESLLAESDLDTAARVLADVTSEFASSAQLQAEVLLPLLQPFWLWVMELPAESLDKDLAAENATAGIGNGDAATLFQLATDLLWVILTPPPVAENPVSEIEPSVETKPATSTESEQVPQLPSSTDPATSTEPELATTLAQALASTPIQPPTTATTTTTQIASPVPAAPTGRAGGKESLAKTAESGAALDAGATAQVVEYEPNAELPPEVEGYLNKVEQQPDQAPPEIVIADLKSALPTAHHIPSQPVIVLPITPEIEQAGQKKSPKFSVRWLVEWSHKIVKMFLGKVIYRFAKKTE